MLSISISNTVELGDGGFTSIFWEWFLSLTWGVFFSSSLSGSSTENDKIEKGVSTKSVGSVN